MHCEKAKYNKKNISYLLWENWIRFCQLYVLNFTLRFIHTKSAYHLFEIRLQNYL